MPSVTNFSEVILGKLEAIATGLGRVLPTKPEPTNYDERVVALMDRVASGAAIARYSSGSTATTLTTAGVVTYSAAQMLGRIILRDPNGAGRSDVTATAAQIVAAMNKPAVGDTVVLYIRNTADAAETITVTPGTGVTISGTATIAQNNAKLFWLVLTNVTPGAEAATLYSVFTGVF